MNVSVFGIILCACCLSASSLEIRTGIFPSRLLCGQPYKFRFEANPIWYSAIKFTKIALSEMLATQMGVTEAQHQNQLVWIVQIWPIFALRRVDSARTRAQLCFVLLVSCYSLLQQSRPAWLELFVDHTHTHSVNNLRWQPHWLPRLTSLPRKSRDWWRTQVSSLGHRE